MVLEMDRQIVLLSVSHCGSILLRGVASSLGKNQEENRVRRRHEYVQGRTDALGVLLPVASEEDVLAKVENPADDWHKAKVCLGVRLCTAKRIGNLSGEPIKGTVHLEAMIPNGETVFLGKPLLCFLVGEKLAESNATVPLEDDRALCKSRQLSYCGESANSTEMPYGKR